MIGSIRNNALGKNNELVWRLPNDFKGSRIPVISLWGEKHSKVFPNHYLTEHML
jgi:hypothetical protein